MNLVLISSIAKIYSVDFLNNSHHTIYLVVVNTIGNNIFTTENNKNFNNSLKGVFLVSTTCLFEKQTYMNAAIAQIHITKDIIRQHN